MGGGDGRMEGGREGGREGEKVEERAGGLEAVQLDRDHTEMVAMDTGGGGVD